MLFSTSVKTLGISLRIFLYPTGGYLNYIKNMGTTTKPGMTLHPKSVLTTCRIWCLWQRISGPSRILVLSHPAHQVGSPPLCGVVSTHFPVLISKRLQNWGRLAPKKTNFKWCLNRKPCSFSMLFLSYLCAFSIYKCYCWNIRVLSWAHLQTFLSFSLLPHP